MVGLSAITSALLRHPAACRTRHGLCMVEKGVGAFRRTATCSVWALAEFLATLVVCDHAAYPLDLTTDISQYRRRMWQMEDGLPQNSVLSMAQTADGYLWLGTADGLARFDGVRFTVFDSGGTPEITNDYVKALWAGRRGDLLVGTYGGGLVRLRDGGFTSYTTKDGLPSQEVHCAYEDRSGNVWIGTTNGLTRFQGGQITIRAARQALVGDSVRAVCEDRSGAIWVGTSTGLYRSDDGGSQFMKMTGPVLSNASVQSLREDRDGSFWVGTMAGDVVRLAGGEVTVVAQASGLAGNLVRSIVQDRDGNIWFATTGGLRRVRPGELSLDKERDQVSSPVGSLLEDPEGNLWVGTSSAGLMCLSNPRVATYSTRQGLSSDSVASVCEDRDGDLWAGTAGGGLNRMRNGKWTAYTSKDGLSSNVVTSLLQDHEGSLWIGTEGAGLNRLKDGKLTRITAKDLSNDIILSLHEDVRGNLWIGGATGLSRFKNGELITFTKKDGLPANEIHCIIDDGQGGLWLATFLAGLVRFHPPDPSRAVPGEDDRFRRYSVEQGLPTDKLFSLYRDPDGTLWIGTFGRGLVRLRDGKFTAYGTREGLLDDSVYQILDDGRGYLWMSSNKGIIQVSKQELDEVATGKRPAVSSVLYGRADGMESSECDGGSQPGGCRTRDGRLWFATVKGLAVVDPVKIRSNPRRPPLFVEGIAVDGSLVPPDRPGRLPPGATRFEFQYAALSFVAPEKVRFRYKLDGFDRAWIDAGTRRTAYYTHLPPGDYTFHVIGCNDDGVWNEKGASWSFYVAPFFFQTKWFYGLCVGGIALFIWGIFQLRVQQLRARNAVLVERNRIARDVHDTLAQGLTGIILQLQAAERSAGAKNAGPHLRRAQEVAQQNLRQVQCAIEGLRPVAGEARPVAEELRRFIEHLSANPKLDITLEVSGRPRALPRATEENLLRVAQEAIVNAVQHSGCRAIRVALRWRLWRLRLEVTDDGTGFDTSGEISAPRTRGLRGMAERAEIIRAELTVAGRQGNGTVVTMVVPLELCWPQVRL